MAQPLRIGSVPSVTDIEFVDRLGQGLGAGRFKARFGDRGETSSLLIVPGDRDERARAGRWARRLAEIDHPGVPSVRRIEEVLEPAFIALDYVEGANLEVRMALTGEPLTEVEALSVTLQAAAALQTTHKRKVAHGALAPRSVILLPRQGAMDAVRLVGWTPPAAHVRFEVYARRDVRGLGALLYAAITGTEPPSMTPAPALPVDIDEEGGGGAFDGVLMDWVEVDRDIGGIGRLAIAAMNDDSPFQTVDQFVAHLRPHFRARLHQAIQELDGDLEHDREFILEVEAKRADQRQLESKLRFVREWLREHEAEVRRVDTGVAGLRGRRRSLQNAEVELEMLLEGIPGALATSVPPVELTPTPAPRAATPPPKQGMPPPIPGEKALPASFGVEPSPATAEPSDHVPTPPPAIDLLLEETDLPTDDPLSGDPRIIRPADRMKTGGGKLLGVLAGAVAIGVALAAWIVVQLAAPSAPEPPAAEENVTAAPAPVLPPPATDPAPEIVPAPEAAEAVEPAPAPEPRAVEPPPPPAGMVAVRGGTLLPGLAEAQLALAMGQCQQDYKRHSEFAELCTTAFDSEPPRGPTEIPAFYIDRFEVSQSAYSDCRRDGPCVRLLLHWDLREQPATGVTHDMAKTYCEWRGLRLPTEPEWSYAARGHADPRLYPWGDMPPFEDGRHKANYGKMGSKRGIPMRDDGHKYAAPVGVFQERGSSPFGVANLGGNVREWTANSDAAGFVVLGGGWKDLGHDLRLTRRQVLEATHSENDLGFRCAKDVTP